MYIYYGIYVRLSKYEYTRLCGLVAGLTMKHIMLTLILLLLHNTSLVLIIIITEEIGEPILNTLSVSLLLPPLSLLL